MKKFKKFMAGICCLAICFLCISCSATIDNKSTTGTSPNYNKKSELVCIALYINVTDDCFDTKSKVIESLNISDNGTIKSNNNFVKVIYSPTGFIDNINLFSDTTIKYSISNFELEISAEVFIETKSVCAYLITKNVNGLSAKFMGTANLENLSSLEFDINKSKIDISLDKIILNISSDITTTDKYVKGNK